MSKPRTSEVIDYLVRYLADYPIEDVDEEAKRLVSEAKLALKRKEDERAERATKEYLINQYRCVEIDLEHAPWFIKWIDKLSPFGHRMFLQKCPKCGGSGKEKAYFSDHEITCEKCRGGGEVEGPIYCGRCRALAIVHLVAGCID